MLGFMLSACLFIFLVYEGITGSSLGLLQNRSPFVEMNVQRLFGVDREVRSDEWLVWSPMALSQSKQIPPFPVVNKSIGLDGQNMLVIGYNGVPVWHLTALFKPATWGFFLLPSRNALSWYWWFPLFGCFIAVWVAVKKILKETGIFPCMISLFFVSSPLFAGWSNWPANVIMFASLIFSSSLGLLTSQKSIYMYANSCLLSFSLAGLFLTLVPAYVIPLSYVVALSFFGILWRDNLYPMFNRIKFYHYLICASITILVIFIWWLDARNAISIISNTLYPGTRISYPGGIVGFWSYIAGWFTLGSMYSDLKAFTNPSEASDFIWFYPVIFIVSTCLFIKYRRIDKFIISLFSILALLTFYKWLGLGEAFAKYTLLGRTTDVRVDISLGLAQVYLFAGFIYFINTMKTEYTLKNTFIIQVLGFVFLIISYLASYIYSPLEIKSVLNPAIKIFLFIFVIYTTYLFICYQFYKFIIWMIIYSASISIGFNPMNRIVKTPNIISSPCNDDSHSKRVLVLGSQIPAMQILAAGWPIVNGVHYYPQFGLWDSIDPQKIVKNEYNRFQHLIVTLGNVDNENNYEVSSPQADVVSLKLNGSKFDFNKIGAECVISQNSDQAILEGNENLLKITQKDNWVAFMVKQR